VNLGTNDGRSCDPRLAAAVVEVLAEEPRFSHVLNGRFKGGYITRHYGDPARQVHALQIELAQACYMDEAGTGYDSARAAPLVGLLQGVVGVLGHYRPGAAASSPTAAAGRGRQ
jgi:N-formylglutamate amidohydrolase